MEPLATRDQVAARSTEEIATAEEIALADAMLAEASAWVRHYGGRPWPTMAEAPEVAVAITAAAASRGYMNPAAFAMERSDMSTFNRNPEYAAGTQLTKSEIAMLKPFSRKGGVISVGLTSTERPAPKATRYSGRYDNRGYAPSDDGTKPYPLGTWP
jgi:hypothetical protein